LSGLRSDPRIDGVLSAHVDQAAATSAHGRYAEPQVLAWDLDFGSAEAFGAAHGRSGLSGPGPAAGHVVVNSELAHTLRLHAGDPLQLYVYGQPHTYAVVRIVETRGLAGTGLGSAENQNVFLPTGELSALAQSAGLKTHDVTLISNEGGVERGADLTDSVSATIRSRLAATGITALVDTPKKTVLDNAKKTGDALGALFLMIGSFSIIAGALLLVNIFVMLADDRRSQLGMLRAIGVKRSRLVASFGLEGAAYAVAATVPGIGLGVLIGWAVSVVAAQIFSSWSTNGGGLDITLAVTPTSIVNASLMGLLIAAATVLATSVRISRFNIIAAIRDLPAPVGSRNRLSRTVTATILALIFAGASVPAIATSSAEALLILPALSAVLFIPLLRLRLPSRAAQSIVAGGIVVWSAAASVIRPAMFDTPSMSVYVIQGSLLAFSAVLLVSQNQTVLIGPLRRFIERPTENALALRLAVAYPVAKRFRTGATLVMYTLIVLVLVLLVEITGVIDRSVDANVAHATAGYSLRVDVDPRQAGSTLAGLTTGPFAGDITATSPIVSAPALADDPGGRTNEPLRALAVGISAGSTTGMTFTDRLPGLATDAAVWQRIADDPRYVALDAYFGATGGPNGRFYEPGDQFTLTDPSTGATYRKTIAGIVSSALVFYPVDGSGGNTYPVIGSAAQVGAEFPTTAVVSAALIRTRAGVDPEALGTQLQGTYLSASLVATPIAADVRRMFAANTAFFRLMQGFLGIGLLVGVTGLGVVMVRAVRERRRTIGVLRALGFPARTVERSFLIESALVAFEGIVLGSILGVLTTGLMYLKSASFDGVRSGYPIEWITIIVLGGATLIASVIATYPPARRAAGIRPAIAVRVAE
jgi:putative ABC transport system permease protein